MTFISNLSRTTTPSNTDLDSYAQGSGMTSELREWGNERKYGGRNFASLILSSKRTRGLQREHTS